jgi:hypothetical protein
MSLGVRIKDEYIVIFVGNGDTPVFGLRKSINTQSLPSTAAFKKRNVAQKKRGK